MPPPLPPSVNDGRMMTGKSNFSGELKPIFQIVDQRRLGNVEADLLHGIFEEEAVFGLLDGADLRADKMNVVFLQNAAVGEFNSEVQRGLSANGRQNSEASAGRQFALHANNFFQIFAGQRLNVSAVGELGIGHDGGRIGIRQHHFEALSLERLASLRAGVIKLRRLANDDGARADDQNFRDVSAFGHLCSFRFVVKSRGIGGNGGLYVFYACRLALHPESCHPEQREGSAVPPSLPNLRPSLAMLDSST